MGKLCSARNCKNRTLTNKNFFRFPTDPASAKIWILNSNREDLIDNLNTLYINQRLCEDHFEERMFLDRKRTRLKYKAFPTLFPLCNDTRGNIEDPFDLDHAHAAAVSTKRLKNVNKVISQASKDEKKVPVVFTGYESTKPSECEEEVYTNYEFLETSKTAEELGNCYTTSKPKKYVPDFYLGNKSIKASKNKTDVCDVFADIVEASNFSKAFSYVQNEVPNLQLGNGFTEASNCAGDFEDEFRDAHTIKHDPVEASKFENNVCDLMENIFVEASKCEQESCDSRVSNDVEITFSEGEICDQEASKYESSVLYTGNRIEFVETPNFQEKIRDVCMHSEITEALKCGKEVYNSNSATESFKSTKFQVCDSYDEIEFAEASNFDEKISDDMHNEIIAVSKYENKVGNLINETENVGALKCATEASDSDDEIEFVEALKFDEKVGYFTSETENVEISKNETEVCDLDEETKFFDALVCNENMKDIYMHNETFAALKCGQKVGNSANETENVESKCKIEVCDSNEEIKVVDVSNFDKKINEFHVYNETFDALKCEQKVENSVVETENVEASNCKTEFCYSNGETESVDASNFDGKINDVNMHNETFAASRCGQNVGNSVSETENVGASNCKIEVCDSKKETEFVDASNFYGKINDVNMHNETFEASRCGQKVGNSVGETKNLEASNCKTEVCDSNEETEFVDASNFYGKINDVHMHNETFAASKCGQNIENSVGETENVESSNCKTEVCDYNKETEFVDASNFNENINDVRMHNETSAASRCGQNIENSVSETENVEASHCKTEVCDYNKEPEFVDTLNFYGKINDVYMHNETFAASKCQQKVLNSISGTGNIEASNCKTEVCDSNKETEFFDASNFDGKINDFHMYNETFAAWKCGQNIENPVSETENVEASKCKTEVCDSYIKTEFVEASKFQKEICYVHVNDNNIEIPKCENEVSDSQTESIEGTTCETKVCDVYNENIITEESNFKKEICDNRSNDGAKFLEEVLNIHMEKNDVVRDLKCEDEFTDIHVENVAEDSEKNQLHTMKELSEHNYCIAAYNTNSPEFAKEKNAPSKLRNLLLRESVQNCSTVSQDVISEDDDDTSSSTLTAISGSVPVYSENNSLILGKDRNTSPEEPEFVSVGQKINSDFLKQYRESSSVTACRKMKFPTSLKKPISVKRIHSVPVNKFLGNPEKQNTTSVTRSLVQNFSSLYQEKYTPKTVIKRIITPTGRVIVPVGHGDILHSNFEKIAPPTDKRKTISVGNENPQKQINTPPLQQDSVGYGTNFSQYLQKHPATVKLLSVNPMDLEKILPINVIKQSTTPKRNFGSVSHGNDSLSDFVKTTASTVKRKSVSVGHENPKKQNTITLSNQNLDSIGYVKIFPKYLQKQTTTPKVQNVTPIDLGKIPPNNSIKQSPTPKRNLGPVDHGNHPLPKLVKSTEKRKFVSVGHDNRQKQNTTTLSNQKQTITPKVQNVTPIYLGKITRNDSIKQSPTPIRSLGPVGHGTDSLSNLVKSTASTAKIKFVSGGHGTDSLSNLVSSTAKRKSVSVGHENPQKQNNTAPLNQISDSIGYVKILPQYVQKQTTIPKLHSVTRMDREKILSKNFMKRSPTSKRSLGPVGHENNSLSKSVKTTTPIAKKKCVSVGLGNENQKEQQDPNVQSRLLPLPEDDLPPKKMRRSQPVNENYNSTVKLKVNSVPPNVRTCKEITPSANSDMEVAPNGPNFNSVDQVNSMPKGEQLTILPQGVNFLSLGHGSNLLFDAKQLTTAPEVLKVVSVTDGNNLLMNADQFTTIPEMRNYIAVGHGNNLLLRSSQLNTEQTATIGQESNLPVNTDPLNLPQNVSNNVPFAHGINLLVNADQLTLPQRAPYFVSFGHENNLLVNPHPLVTQEVLQIRQGEKTFLLVPEVKTLPPEVRKYVLVSDENNSVLNPQETVPLEEIEQFQAVVTGINLPVNSGVNFAAPEVLNCIPGNVGISSSVESVVKSAEVRRCISVGLEDISSVNSGVKSAEVRRYIPAGLEDTSSVNSGVKSAEVRRYISAGLEDTTSVNSGVKSVASKVPDGNSVGTETGSFMNSGVKSLNPIECEDIPVGIEASSCENSGVKYANSNLREFLSVRAGIDSIASSEVKTTGSTSDKTTDTFVRSVVKTEALGMRKFDSVMDSFDSERQKSLTKEIHVSVSSTQTDCYLSANSPRKKKLRQWIKELNRENKFLKRRLLQVERQLSNKC